MNEQEMRAEIERLRRELTEAREDRNRLHKLVCSLIPFDPPEVVENQVQEMMKSPLRGIDDIIADLLRDEQDSQSASKQIPA